MGIFSKRKVNTEEPVTDEQADKKINRIGFLTARQTGKTVGKAGLFSKGAFTAAAGIMALMGSFFLASAMMSFEGAFTIKAVMSGEAVTEKVIALSETQGFSNPTVNLKAQPFEDMDNTTYAWLPLEELEAYDGSHNGENYIAYTFYLKNAGKETMDYSASLNIVKSTLNIDRAMRVMVYKDGVPTIYARQRDNGTSETYPEKLTDFYNEDTVMYAVEKGVEPDTVTRYTAVIWLEGEDPECVDNVRGGMLKMEMVFEILDDEDGNQLAETTDESEMPKEETTPQET